jgi:hypothetical protein
LIIIVCFFLGYGINRLDAPTFSTVLFREGLGTHAMTIINFPSWTETSWGDYGLFTTVLLSNMSQVVLSAVYIVYNGVFTSMLQAAELNDYSVKRKGLRISTTPEGAQRSTYFLSLPFRYSIPLLILSAIIHWLVSQSIFLVSILQDTLIVNSSTVTGDSNSSNFTCGYSPISILLVVIISIVMITVAVLLGLKRFKTGMPIAGSCSAAISAACHPISGTDHEVLVDQGLHWGVMGINKDGVPHCGFSTGDVDPPQAGTRYE